MPETRRTIVRWLLGGGLASTIAAFLYPVLRFMNPPQVAEASVNEVVACKSQDLKANSGRIVRFGSRPVLLVRTPEAELRAFSAVCTHLNCTVQYREDLHQIWCACHNGLYDLHGAVVSGPPPKPLEEFLVRLRGEDVVVARPA